MTQEKINEVFKTELSEQLNEIFVTSDDECFIRRSEAEEYSHNVLKEDSSNINVWYPEY
jgi:hypothetical protein